MPKGVPNYYMLLNVKLVIMERDFSWQDHEPTWQLTPSELPYPLPPFSTPTTNKSIKSFLHPFQPIFLFSYFSSFTKKIIIGSYLLKQFGAKHQLLYNYNNFVVYTIWIICSI